MPCLIGEDKCFGSIIENVLEQGDMLADVDRPIFDSTYRFFYSARSTRLILNLLLFQSHTPRPDYHKPIKIGLTGIFPMMEGWKRIDFGYSECRDLIDI
jgi:hypothetical protein